MSLIANCRKLNQILKSFHNYSPNSQTLKTWDMINLGQEIPKKLSSATWAIWEGFPFFRSLFGNFINIKLWVIISNDVQQYLHHEQHKIKDSWRYRFHFCYMLWHVEIKTWWGIFTLELQVTCYINFVINPIFRPDTWRLQFPNPQNTQLSEDLWKLLSSNSNENYVFYYRAFWFS